MSAAPDQPFPISLEDKSFESDLFRVVWAGKGRTFFCASHRVGDDDVILADWAGNIQRVRAGQKKPVWKTKLGRDVLSLQDMGKLYAMGDGIFEINPDTGEATQIVAPQRGYRALSALYTGEFVFKRHGAGEADIITFGHDGDGPYLCYKGKGSVHVLEGACALIGGGGEVKLIDLVKGATYQTWPVENLRGLVGAVDYQNDIWMLGDCRPGGLGRMPGHKDLQAMNPKPLMHIEGGNNLARYPLEARAVVPHDMQMVKLGGVNLLNVAGHILNAHPSGVFGETRYPDFDPLSSSKGGYLISTHDSLLLFKSTLWDRKNEPPKRGYDIRRGFEVYDCTLDGKWGEPLVSFHTQATGPNFKLPEIDDYSDDYDDYFVIRGDGRVYVCEWTLYGDLFKAKS